jgi:polygalacturonase
MQDIVGERWFGKYARAEWRMALALRGCSNIKVHGLTLRDSGGDGIMVCGGTKRPYSKDIYIKDVTCDNNHRQGISVTNVVGLVVENCTFNNTWGTPPCSGVDLEPDTPRDRMQHITFRDCRFENNYGDGIEVFLAHQSKASADVSILFERCHVSSHRGTGIRVTKILDDGPQGLVEFRDCVVDGAVGYGIKVQDKAPDKARVRFVNCSVKNAAQNRQYMGAWAPVWLHLFRPEYVKKFGGIDFINCTIENTRARPAIVAECASGLFDITGSITVHSPHGVKVQFPGKVERVTLTVKPQ